MKRKVQFAVILTDEKKTVLVVDNSGVFRSVRDWEKRYSSSNGTVIFCSETDSLSIDLSHYFIS